MRRTRGGLFANDRVEIALAGEKPSRKGCARHLACNGRHAVFEPRVHLENDGISQSGIRDFEKDFLGVRFANLQRAAFERFRRKIKAHCQQPLAGLAEVAMPTIVVAFAGGEPVNAAAEVADGLAPGDLFDEPQEVGVIDHKVEGPCGSFGWKPGFLRDVSVLALFEFSLTDAFGDEVYYRRLDQLAKQDAMVLAKMLPQPLDFARGRIELPPPS